MISFSFDSEDINSLILTASCFGDMKELKILRNFRLTDDNFLDFDIDIGLSFTIHIYLACDSYGKIIASIAKLTNYRLLDKALSAVKLLAPCLIQMFSNHYLVAESLYTVSFSFENLAKQMMDNMKKEGTEHDLSTEKTRQLITFLSGAKFQNVFIQNNQLCIDVVLNGDKNAS